MENKFKYIVYQTINIINNKIYIGVHKTENPDVFDGYIGNGVNINWPSSYMDPKYPFQKAVKKYGTSNFRRSTLYIFNSKEEAFDKERELVNYDFVNRKDTYNCILGGNLRPLYYNRNNVYQYDEQGLLLKKWDDVFDVSSFFGIWKESVYSAISTKNRLMGYYWSYNTSINILEYSNPNKARRVYKYNENGKCIEIYDSIQQAAKENGYKACNLFNRIKEYSLTKGNYYSFELFDNYVPISIKSLKNRIIYVYSENGEFEKAIPYKELKSYLGITSNKSITTTIKSKSLINSKQLRLEKYDKIEPYIKPNKSKAVVVYTTSGEFIGEYDSINKVCRELNLDNSCVNRVLRGVNKTTKGYIIKLKI